MKLFCKNKEGLSKRHPITSSRRWHQIVMHTDIHDCKLYILEDKNIAVFLDVWSEMKKRNIELVTIKRKG